VSRACRCPAALGRRLGVEMNKLVSTGNEQDIDVAEFIACLERPWAVSFMRCSAYWRRFASNRPVD
jgi:hypothetical protein